MLESVYARVMIFLFARVHIQSAYHSEQTHFEQFPCITSEQYLVWACMVCYMVKHATPQPTQVYATWCGRGGVLHAGMCAAVRVYYMGTATHTINYLDQLTPSLFSTLAHFIFFLSPPRLTDDPG